jgi:hypothetical protein
MLLSFERPASAGGSLGLATGCRRAHRLSTDLENCTVANETGITDQIVDQITVKIVRAHGGCLGT